MDILSLALRPCVISYCVPWKSQKEISLSLCLSHTHTHTLHPPVLLGSVWTTKLVPGEVII